MYFLNKHRSNFTYQKNIHIFSLTFSRVLPKAHSYFNLFISPPVVFLKLPDWLWGPVSFLFNGNLPGLKRPRRETNHCRGPRLRTAELYFYSLVMPLGVDMDNFTFTFTILPLIFSLLYSVSFLFSASFPPSVPLRYCPLFLSFSVSFISVSYSFLSSYLLLVCMSRWVRETETRDLQVILYTVARNTDGCKNLVMVWFPSKKANRTSLRI